MKAERIQHGIEWGSSKITLMFDDDEKEWVTWGLETPKYKGQNRIQIYVTKTGKVRINDTRGEWSPPKGKRK